jgi:hypothetical protein
MPSILIGLYPNKKSEKNMKIQKQNLAHIGSFVFILVTIVVLMPGLLNNSWITVGKKWFVDWRTVKDAPFVGRLVQSRQAGIFSYAGLLGWGDASIFEDDWEMVTHQYEVYKTSASFMANDFKTYSSAIDFQGVIFSALEQFLNISPERALLAFQFTTALLTATILSLLALWIYSELGLMAAIFTVGFMVLSEWITLFGGSIYWSLWAIYLPLVATAYFFREKQDGGGSQYGLALVVYFAMLIKCLFNGFEYITTVLIMVFMPLAYYALANRWQLKLVMKNCWDVFVAEFLSITTALFILLAQNAFVLGGVREAYNYIVYSLEKRSIGNPSAFTDDPALVESLQAGTLMVVKEYILGRAVKLNLAFVSNRFPFFRLKELEIGYLAIFIFFLAVTALFFVLQKVHKQGEAKLSSFIIVTWLSVLAPLSWFVIFKAHSYLHLHLNFIVWQMPFALFGFAMCGAVLGLVINFLLTRLNLRQ